MKVKLLLHFDFELKKSFLVCVLAKQMYQTLLHFK